MKRAFTILLLVILFGLSICILQRPVIAGSSDKVLLIVKESFGAADLEIMRANEAILMKTTLEEAGYRVEVGSVSGRNFLIKDVTLESNYNLAEVNVADYVGFIITCSALGNNTSDYKQVLAFGETYVKPEEVEIAKQIAATGKPLAAQHKGVIILAQAGALEGKKYSYDHDLRISDATYGGRGVILAGNVITSTYCPFHADDTGHKDQTTELTKALIISLQQ